MIRIFLLIIILLCTGFSCSDETSSGPMVVSVSSDGRYVISSHQSNKAIILWDVTQKSSKTISKNGNIYSVYFIKHTPYFMWQDLKDMVHIQDITGKEILTFHHFPTYGQVMTSDLQHYVASDDNWCIARDFGVRQSFIKSFTKSSEGNFEGYQKLLNLTLSNDDQYLLTSGFGYSNDRNSPDEIAWWNVNTKKLRYILSDNRAKTIAALSPDGKYIVGGDEDMHNFVWNAHTGKQVMELDDTTMGRRITLPNCDSEIDPVKCCYFVNDGIINPPFGYDKERLDSTFAIKFIDLKGHYLRFITYKPYAILYSVYDRRPIKYFYLSQWPATVNMGGYYTRDEAIDTAPEANILVVGQRYNTGIIVYKFDVKNLTLKKIWSATA